MSAHSQFEKRYAAAHALRSRVAARAHSPSPGSPRPPRPMSPSICCAFASTPACAERSASFTPARTRSPSASGSSGSIASGEISIATHLAGAVRGHLDEAAADGRLRGLLRRLLLHPLHLLLHLLRPAASACSCRRRTSAAQLSRSLRVERLLEQLEDPLLAGRLVVGRRRLARLAEREREREPAAGDVVERVGEQRRVLRVAGEVEVELRARRELERERVAARARAGCASRSSDAVGMPPRSSTAGSTVRAQASWSCASSSAGGAPTGTGTGSGCGVVAAPSAAASGAWLGVCPGRGAGARPDAPCSSRSSRKAIDSRERSLAGRVTLTSASSSGRRGSPPWRMSSTATASRSSSRSTVASPSWFACARSRSRVSSVDAARLRHLAHVLDEHQVAQVLDQVEDEPAEVVALLRELLDEGERAGRVAVDHEVAEPEERLLLDRAEQLRAPPAR